MDLIFDYKVVLSSSVCGVKGSAGFKENKKS